MCQSQESLRDFLMPKEHQLKYQLKSEDPELGTTHDFFLYSHHATRWCFRWQQIRSNWKVTPALASLGTPVLVNRSCSCVQPALVTLVNRISFFQHWDAQQSNPVVTPQCVNKDIVYDTLKNLWASRTWMCADTRLFTSSGYSDFCKANVTISSLGVGD